MKIATFNVNSVNARLDLIKRWLTEKNPVDILCMQEIKCEEERFPFEDFKELGYECTIFGQKAYNGVAICSKFPMEDIKRGFGDAYWDEQKRLIRAKINGIHIVNVYAPHGDVDGDRHIYKLEFFHQLKNLLAKEYDLEKEPVLVMGDMNVAREDIDVWEPELLRGTIGFMDDEREAFEDFLSVGLHDLFRELHPDVHGFTWWDYMSGAIWRDQGMRIDYMLGSNEAKRHCKDVVVDLWTRKRRKPTPSDHAPVVGEFTF